MKMKDVQKKAKAMGVTPGKLRKSDLIKSIQSAEGNEQCYQSEGSANCEQMDCCWREDCI